MALFDPAIRGDTVFEGVTAILAVVRSEPGVRTILDSPWGCRTQRGPSVLQFGG
jgi:hypothetical protein